MSVYMWVVLSDEEYQAYMEDGFLDSSFLFSEYSYALESQQQIGGSVYQVEMTVESLTKA